MKRHAAERFLLQLTRIIVPPHYRLVDGKKVRVKGYVRNIDNIDSKDYGTVNEMDIRAREKKRYPTGRGYHTLERLGQGAGAGPDIYKVLEEAIESGKLPVPKKRKPYRPEADDAGDYISPDRPLTKADFDRAGRALDRYRAEQAKKPKETEAQRQARYARDAAEQKRIQDEKDEAERKWRAEGNLYPWETKTKPATKADINRPSTVKPHLGPAPEATPYRERRSVPQQGTPNAAGFVPGEVGKRSHVKETIHEIARSREGWAPTPLGARKGPVGITIGGGTSYYVTGGKKYTVGPNMEWARYEDAAPETFSTAARAFKEAEDRYRQTKIWNELRHARSR